MRELINALKSQNNSFATTMAETIEKAAGEQKKGAVTAPTRQALQQAFREVAPLLLEEVKYPDNDLLWELAETLVKLGILRPFINGIFKFYGYVPRKPAPQRSFIPLLSA